MHQGISLSLTDRVILNSYRSVLDGLADYLGNGFEFVLHSLENHDESVIKIINGAYTGRKLGAPITDLALSMLSKIEKEKLDGYISYESKNKTGRKLRSTTIVIHGEQRRPIGLLCINFYVDTPLSQCFPFFELFNETTYIDMQENFATNVDSLIQQAYDEAHRLVMADDSISTTLKNKEIIQILYAQGIFRMKDAVVKVADVMDVSKNTVYMHIRSIRDKGEE